MVSAAHKRSALRSLKVFSELANVTRILKEAGIPSIALKGAYLAQFAYPSPALRPMRDLDLLLRPEQCMEAFEVFRGCGYEPTSEGRPEIQMEERHHLAPLKGRGRICIELHGGLLAPNPEFRLDSSFMEGFWMRSATRRIGPEEIRFPCPEDMLFHLCLHATLEHDFDLGPLALADIALLLESENLDLQEILYPENLSSGISKLAEVLFPSRKAISIHFPADPSSPAAYLYYPAYLYRLFRMKLSRTLKALFRRNASFSEYSRHRMKLCGWLRRKPAR